MIEITETFQMKGVKRMDTYNKNKADDTDVTGTGDDTAFETPIDESPMDERGKKGGRTPGDTTPEYTPASDEDDFMIKE